MLQLLMRLSRLISGADDIKLGVYPEQKENKLLELMESLGDEEVSVETSLKLKLETFIQSIG